MSDGDDINDTGILYCILALSFSQKILIRNILLIYRIKSPIQVTKIIPMQRYEMYGHAYKISKFGKFDLFARMIIRAVLEFAHLEVREK